MIRIVVLNYNGEALLPRCLPSIVGAAQSSKYSVKVTLLDNLSQDDGLEYVRREFPQVEIVHAPENLVLGSYNRYLEQMQEPIAILLNNDIRVDKNFVDPIIRKFEEDPKTFLVAPRVLSFDGTTVEAGRTRSFHRFGMFWCDARYPGYEREVMTPSDTYSSGFGAFSREFFLRLGGYDHRFFPGIMEDVDLCHRARQAGYSLYYEPQSMVYHMGQASFKKAFGASKIQQIAQRNTFLFMWKNFHTWRFWPSHIFWLPFRLLYALIKGNYPMWMGFWAALQMVGKKKS
ncbi:MAG: glycosyltransferase [Candidatus Omnitrophica bacterium]|nr:glycosyltransferase [Candidatus Omnitrophota bacterium]